MSLPPSLRPWSALLAAALLALPAAAAEKKAEAKAPAAKAEEKKHPWSEDTWSGLELRSVGPALTSGRIADFAVDGKNPKRYFVATASGGVWLTENAGTTWTPLFDGEGSYSIGCVTLDPNDPLTVWVGTGENNSQRSVSYGDGVYRSQDGGKSWENLGLKASEHISEIIVDPRDSRVVYVAAQGPLWAPGGDRGLYKTTDGGKTWKAVLTISENTGVNDVVMDPRHPDVLYASAYQRRRHVFTLVNGGPESAVYKTTDAGATWQKLTKGLPKEDLGRIGLALSPADPDVLYAIVEAANKAGGFFRSRDRGANFEKRSDQKTDSPQYYHEIIADPEEVDRVYLMDTWMKVTTDGGATFKKVNEANKHSDNHALWIDPADTAHLLNGNDGGVYESFDRAATWSFKPNLPVTQFYRVSVDNDAPIYNIYGGTQDNFTLGGPSRTQNIYGIANQDWSVIVSGDGFEAVADPEDPDTVYAQAQNGALSRFDRKTGEIVFIQPQAKPGEEPLRWNWDSPLLISPHRHTRLYFAAQRLYRSEDRGNSWTAVSGDLTRHLDRNTLKVMGKLWGPDAVSKGASTSWYGNAVSFDESPRVEGLLYLGTDDGLLQVSEDGGQAWRKLDTFPGVPNLTFVAEVEASRHADGTVYAAFDNHKNGDFKPYLLKSTDRGRTWTSIASDLPARGTVYTVAEDHLDPDLLFAGTEFGLFFTRDGGRHWVRLKGNLPTIAVKDLTIQRRENDLVLATFGRGFYVLDDYTPLRHARPADLEKDSVVFPVKKTAVYVPAQPLGYRQSFQGAQFYLAPNPPFGAVFTYYLKDDLKAKKKLRQEQEKEALKKSGEVAYPSFDALRAEAREEEPAVVITVSDAEGNVVRRLTGPSKAGVHRVAWDFRYPAAVPTTTDKEPGDAFSDFITGPLVLPGRYTATFARRVAGRLEPFGEPQAFEAAAAAGATGAERADLAAFLRKTARLQRAVTGAVAANDEMLTRVAELKKALFDLPGRGDEALFGRVQAVETKLKDVKVALEGDPVLRSRNEPYPPSIVDRVDNIVAAQWNATAGLTQTSRESYEAAATLFAAELARLKAVQKDELEPLEAAAEAAGAPWSPGRALPSWSKE